MSFKSIILAFFCITMLNTYAVPPEKIFKYANASSEANIYQSLTDSLGNIYVLGRYNEKFTYLNLSIVGNSSQESSDFFIMKISPNGTPVYLKAIRASEANQYINIENFTINNRGEVAFIVNGEAISGLIIGNRTVTASADTPPNMLIKIGSTGITRFIKQIEVNGIKGGVDPEVLRLGPLGGVFIAGSFWGERMSIGEKSLNGFGNNSKMFVAAINRSGIVEWLSSCETQNDFIDSIGDIKVHKMELSPNGQVIVAGIYSGVRNFVFNKNTLKNQGVENAFLASFSLAGNAQWAAAYEGNNMFSPEDITVDERGDIIFACYFKTDRLELNGQVYASSNVYDLMISKYDRFGRSLWDKVLNSNLVTVWAYRRECDIQVGDSMDVYLAGEFMWNGVRSLYFYEFDEGNGYMEWQQTSTNANDMYFENLHIGPHGDILFAGTTYNTFDMDESTFTDATGSGMNYLVSIKNNGKINFVFKRQNISSNLFFNGLGSDNFGNIFMTGSFNGSSVNLGEKTIQSPDGNGLFFAKYAGINQISGKVIDYTGTDVTSGWIKLIGYSYKQRCPIEDSVEIADDGTYLLERIPAGRYLLQFLPDNSGDKKYLPMYYPSAAHWMDADKLNIIDGNDYSGKYILVPRLAEQSGKNKLGGNITEEEEDDLFKSTQKRPNVKSRSSLARGKPKSDWEIIQVTYTDEFGDFEFNNVEDGDYVVLVEIPGLVNETIHEVSVTGGKYLSNINYFVDEESINAVDIPTTSDIETENIESNSYIIYPNPSAGNINISIKPGKSISSMEMYDLQGRLINKTGKIFESYTLTDIMDGIYILRVDNNGEIFSHKLIVEP